MFENSSVSPNRCRHFLRELSLTCGPRYPCRDLLQLVPLPAEPHKRTGWAGVQLFTLPSSVGSGDRCPRMDRGTRKKEGALDSRVTGVPYGEAKTADWLCSIFTQHRAGLLQSCGQEGRRCPFMESELQRRSLDLLCWTSGTSFLTLSWGAGVRSVCHQEAGDPTENSVEETGVASPEVVRCRGHVCWCHPDTC